MSNPILRFAPSPTGYLHIGGARTALFNWLRAKNSGGKLLLRIEDTDRARSTEPAIDAIIAGLTWLGLDYETPVVFQHSRIERHREVVQQLLAAGKAYSCFATAQELQAMRDEARAAKLPPHYNRMWRDRDPSEAPAGVRPAIRLKMPLEGVTEFVDEVQGKISIQNKELDDMIILRSDDTPTYMLAVVVDDHDMGITEVIRGADHLTNTARQMQLFHACAWQAPRNAHLPLIHGSDGNKLSKRHGAVGVEKYREDGYLADATLNYLLRLGWSDGDQEFFSRTEMIEKFSMSGLRKSPSRFDLAKLQSINSHYLRARKPEALVSAIAANLDYLTNGAPFKAIWSPAFEKKLLSLIPALQPRSQTLVDLLDGARFLTLTRPIQLADASKVTTDDLAVVVEFSAVLRSVQQWHDADLSAAARDFVAAKGIKLKDLAVPLRYLLTGEKVSPPIFLVMEVLGQSECLARLGDATDENNNNTAAT